MLKKAITLVGCIALSGSLLAGCSSSDSKSAISTAPSTAESTDTSAKKISGEILFYSHWTDRQNDIFPKYIAEFNKLYPDVKVNVETVGDTYQDGLKIKFSANDVPDVFEPDNRFKEQMMQYALPLDDLPITQDFIGTEYFKGTDNKTYALPEGLNTYGVIYNKKIFKELALEVPTTLDQFIAAAQKINAAGKVGVASAAKAKWPLQYYWQSVPLQLSGDPNATNKLADTDEPFTKDSPVVQSYAILKKLSDAKIFEKDPLSADWEPMKKEFRSGNVGMFFLGNWFVPQAVGDALKEEDIGFFPFPYDNNGGKNVVVAPDNGFSISKTSKNPEAALAFFNFLNDTKYAELVKLGGFMSARKSISVENPYFEEFNSFKPIQIVGATDSAAYQTIANKMQFDYRDIAQAVLTGKDFDKIFTDVNTKWKKAKADR
ncbi:carbohydrate ABC transporter substrate-binding protein [Paenibacillus psychroresistens]|uniref:Carbohydrate ABC transporter substrate-binding protein n=1 Tax=Paenibacillus psychroresistens TaxID=1778678 RepID=A0A6B8RHG2_9BACL|nr:ABC transporter substrate-binding protein [Paenibacillus psychroresistens]QGQ95035.1 carbohydrate ABC transporter substrate-binding protein [Paenibacillus psychroresistens]